MALAIPPTLASLLPATEKQRGLFGYVIAGIIAYYINILLSKTTTLSVTQTSFIAIYAIGNLIVYTFDILFAKDSFYINNQLTPVPHTDLATRAQWLLSSFLDKYFFRFLVTVVIDTIIGLTILRVVILYLDKLKIFPNWKYRNYLAAFVVATLTYILYLGTLRFQWAYQPNTPLILDITVMAWVSLALLIYATNQNFLQQDLPWRFFYAKDKDLPLPKL